MTTPRHSRRFLLMALAAGLLLSGCAARTPSQGLVGRWHGIYRTGNVSAESEWEFNRSGTETFALTLPQGKVLAEGTWTLRAGNLTQRTNKRTIDIDGQQKTILLVTPTQSVYSCVVAVDTLTLTRQDTQETFVLRRET